MPTMCPRCRGVDGAHFPWCTFASLFERLLDSPTPVVVPETETAEAAPVADKSEALAVYARKQDELTAELTAEKRKREAAEANAATLRTELDGFRSQRDHARGDRDTHARELAELRNKLTEVVRERDLLRTRTAQAVPGADRQTIEELRRQVQRQDEQQAGLVRKIEQLQAKLNEVTNERNVARAALAARGPVKSQAEINRERAEEVRQAARRAQEHRRQQAEAQATEEAERLAADRAEQAELSKRVRRERTWSQAQLAEALGVSGGMIGQVETQRSGFGSEPLRRLKSLAAPVAPRVEIPTEPQALKDHVDKIAEKSQAVQQRLRDELDAGTQAQRAADRAAKAAAPTPPESLEEAARALPPTTAAPSQQGTAKEARSKEAADLAAAAELFVAEHVTKAPGQRLKSADLQAAFTAWLPSVGFSQQHTAAFTQARSVGVAMGKAGYGKRQIKDPESNSQPIYYLGASLAADVHQTPRESESQEGESPSAPPRARPEPDHVAAVASMRAAAREAKRTTDGKTLKGTKPGRELKSEPIRRMATTLVEELGWGYELRKTGGAVGSSHPNLITSDGRRITLPGTPGDRRTVTTTRAKLRRYLRQDLGMDDDKVRRLLP